MASISEESLLSAYHESNPFAGVTGRRWEQLMMLHRAFSGPFDAAQAAPTFLQVLLQTTWPRSSFFRY